MTHLKSSNRHRSHKASKLAEHHNATAISSTTQSETDQNSAPALLARLSSPVPSPQKSTYLMGSHLLSAEYELRKVGNICLYCGTSGHFYHSCEHPASSASLRKSMLDLELDASTEARCAI